MEFVKNLIKVFQKHSNVENMLPMQAYMKHKFEFLGIKSPDRKLLLKDVLNAHKEEVNENCRLIASELYDLPQREYHYCAMEITDKCLKNRYNIDDITLIEKLICAHSHWDTVDFIAKHILGNYLLIYPKKTKEIISHFSSSDNMWLNRSAILHQLGYKGKTNSSILFDLCLKHAESKEFFIQKAIGWALREYAKVDAKSVLAFVKSHKLSNLSQREALKHLN